MDVLVIIVIVLAVAGLGFVLWRSPHPEDISGHADGTEPDSRSEQLYGYSERPAGPDAEAMGTDGSGGTITGSGPDPAGPEGRSGPPPGQH
jgi:hypothetical protein